MAINQHQKVTYGILGVIAILMGFGGTMLLTQEQVDAGYVCTINENLAFFQRLSSTGKTGYWIDEFGVEKSKVCTNGIWMPLTQYAEANGVDINTIIEQQEAPARVVGSLSRPMAQFTCDPDGCVEKE